MQQSTLRQLRSMAFEQGIQGYSRMSREQLIAALCDRQADETVVAFSNAFQRQWPTIRAQLDRN